MTDSYVLNQREQRRLENAIRIGEHLQNLQKAGYTLIDEGGEIVQGEIVFGGWNGAPGISIQHNPNVSTIIFDGLPDSAFGLGDTIEETNKRFGAWKAIAPKNAKSALKTRLK